MEHNEPIASARARFVMSYAYTLEQQRRMRPRLWVVLSIVLGVPVLVYCITKIAFRAVWSFVTGAVFWEGISMWLAVALLLAYIVALALFLFAPRRKAKRYERRAKELFGALPEIRMAFLSDALLVQSPASESGMRVPYAVIKACVETRNLFLLITKEKQIFPVAKQGLLDVDLPGFRTLIREKCPNATIKFVA